MGPYSERTRNHGTYCVTGACRSSAPRSTSWSAMSAANDLEIEPISKRVSSVTGAPVKASAFPTGMTPRRRSRSVRPSTAPGASRNDGRLASRNPEIRSKAASSSATPLREEELELALRRLRRVAAVHKVLGDERREVSADRSRRGARGVGRAHQAAEHRNGLLSLQLREDDGAGGDELDELAEERLLPVLAVVLLRGGAVDALHPEVHDPKAFRFDAAEDLPRQSASDGIRLRDQQRRLFGHVR